MASSQIECLCSISSDAVYQHPCEILAMREVSYIIKESDRFAMLLSI